MHWHGADRGTSRRKPSFGERSAEVSMQIDSLDEAAGAIREDKPKRIAPLKTCC
jgi:hypothetical protein